MSPRNLSLRAVLLLAGGGLWGCHREPSAAEVRPSPAEAQVPAPVVAKEVQAATAVATPAAPDVAKHAPQTKRTAKGRVVAIGDLHGDLNAATGALELAKVIDDKENWIGGDTVVVQTGDVLDRGSQERRLLEFLDRLEAKAKDGGGAVYRLNGNHEIMNVSGDLRYVSPEGFADFAGSASGPFQPSAGNVPKEARGRRIAFMPGQPWAAKLSQYPVVLQVDDTVFAHGGLRPSHVDYGLERMNAEVSAWMRGKAPLPNALQGDDTPYWIRDYGDEVSPEACAALDVALSRLSAKRLVVGHTVQKEGITFACDGKVARIDVGLSAYYGHRAPTVLEIKGGQVKVLDGAAKH